MQDINIQALWDADSVQADQEYQMIQSNVIDLAQQQSQSIIQKVLRQTFAELIFGFVLLIGMSTYLWDVPKVLLGIFVVYSLTTLWISFQFWNNFRIKARKVHAQDTKSAIQIYLYLLRSYKAHLWNYSISLIPFTVFIGFIGGYCKGSDNQLATIFESQILWISLLAIILLMIIGYIMIRQYFRLVIDTKIEELEMVLEGLEE